MSEKIESVKNAQMDIYTEGFNKYNRLGGESEARLTEARQALTALQRMEAPFYKKYDVPFDEMILR